LTPEAFDFIKNGAAHLLRFIGAAVCHQDESRSLAAGGTYLPVCARCTGLYLGFFTSFIYLALRKRLSGDSPPGLFIVSAAAAGIFLFILDGATSYLGLRESHNLLRLTTGVLCGAPLPVLFTLAANYDPAGHDRAAIIKHKGEYAALILAPLVTGLLVCFGKVGSWYAVSVIVCAGEFAMLASFFALILKLAVPKPRRTRRIIPALSAAAAIVLSNAVQAAISS